jgi:tetrahydromethanopterin S-methyltransferase subunit D
LGVDEDVENTFGLYPNPASDELFITSAKDVNGTTVLEVTSIAGKRVMVNTVGCMNANGRVRLDVSGLGQGMYLLSVQTAEDRSVIRFNVTR